MNQNIEIKLEMMMDEQLGIIGGSHFKCILDFIFLLVEKIYKWLSPPKESLNYNAAYEILKSQLDTCQWFLKGSTFSGWLKQPGFFWIKGKCRLSVKD